MTISREAYEAMNERENRIEQAIADAIDVRDPSHTAPLETPQWGEEAADIIIKMSEERALHIEQFGAAIVYRAQEWNRLACELATNIRDTAEKEAQAIRKETARMLKAGNAIEAAFREFSPSRASEPEKWNKLLEKVGSDLKIGRPSEGSPDMPAPAFLRQRPV